MFNSNFSPLAGLLGVGYCLHPQIIPIMRNNKKQENNERDVSIGYFLVFLSYVLIGVFGYFGFTGIYFSEYEKLAPESGKPLA